MAFRKFPVEVLTPEGLVFDEEVEMVATRTVVGEIGIRARHAPLLAIVDPTELRLYRSEDEIVRFAQGEGYLQMDGQRVLVLVDEAVRPGDLNVADLETKLKEAEREIEQSEPDTEEHRVAERHKRRMEVFLEVAQRD